MFDFLKKKIAVFADKVKEKLTGSPVSSAKEEAQLPKAIEETPVIEAEPEIIEEAQQAAPLKDIEEKENEEEGIKKEETGKKETEKPVSKDSEKKEISKIAHDHGIFPQVLKEKKPIEIPQKEIFSKAVSPKELPAKPSVLPKVPDDKRELKAKVSLGTRLAGFVLRKIKISESDVSGFLFELELALLESDVEQDAALEIISNLKKELVGKELSAGQEVSVFLKGEIRKSLATVMDSAGRMDFFSEVLKHKPFVVLFLGPNGAGKTTTISKLAYLLAERGKKTILSASDTFRAASIEQLEEHGKRIGARVVKHSYGSDPAAVAFDAINSAKAHGIDVVFIDSAGRQETNKNLMGELKKIARVAKPDLKIYVGESYAGQNLLFQAEEFDKELGIDAFILTKADADAKGGTAISLLYRLKKPIAFIGTGQGYNDLIEFEPSFILDRIV